MNLQDLNQTLRFILEILALAALGYWGWNTGTGITQYVLAIGAPLVAAAIWALFRVEEEAPEHPVVKVTGGVRITTEVTLFTVAVVLLYITGQKDFAFILALLMLVHYVLDYERVGRLLD